MQSRDRIAGSQHGPRARVMHTVFHIQLFRLCTAQLQEGIIQVNCTGNHPLRIYATCQHSHIPPSQGSSPGPTHLISPGVLPGIGWSEFLRGQCPSSGQPALPCQSLSARMGWKVSNPNPRLPIHPPLTANTPLRSRICAPHCTLFLVGGARTQKWHAQCPGRVLG